MKKIKQPPATSYIKIVGFFGLGILTGLLMLFAVARLVWHDKFYPGITVAGIEVSGLSHDVAKEKVQSAIAEFQPSLVFNGHKWIAPKNIVEYQIENSLNAAYQHGRRLNIQDYLLLVVNKSTNYPLILAEGTTSSMESLINGISESVEIAPIDAEVALSGKEIKVINGSDGIILDSEKLSRDINDAYSTLNQSPIVIGTKVVNRQLTKEELDLISQRANSLVGAKITLTQDDATILVNDKELVAFLETGKDLTVPVNVPRVEEYINGVAESLEREPQDAIFEFADGKVTEFAPGKDGVMVEVDISTSLLTEAINKLLNNENKHLVIQLATQKTPPSVTTDKVNELGIKERIGRGESYYSHSIPNRIFNVGLASTRANSALIAPGEEFSFNKVVGEISGATGYRAAYVISGGRTVLGDGGGVCQVSTTLFRGAMNAGLPITERWAHAYRVGYYEQNSKPGIDATVYSPSKDLRFLNDTPGHILVQTINDPKTLHLVVEIYGTNDGRVATISEPKIWGIAPPPPDIIQEDPSLPSGTTKQVDWAASGAKTSFDYKVVRNGETLQEKTFTSVYRPWANVYLKGTGQ